MMTDVKTNVSEMEIVAETDCSLTKAEPLRSASPPSVQGEEESLSESSASRIADENDRRAEGNDGRYIEDASSGQRGERLNI